MSFRRRRKTVKVKNNFPFDAVFYDLDGTLIDSVPVITLCFRKAYEAVLGRCDRSEEDLKSYIGKPLVETFAMHDEVTAKRLFDKYLEINLEYLKDDMIPLFPYIEEDLLYIKSLGIRQGIVTSKRKESAMYTIELKGFDKIFDSFVFHEDTERHKPSGEPLIKAARDLGITDMKRILYVGDALPDLQSSADAGAPFALVSWTRMPVPSPEEYGSYTVLDRLKDIPCIIADSEL